MEIDTDFREEFHDLGTIRVDPPRRPLGLDKMFHRAQAWVTRSARLRAPGRSPSPALATPPLALPLPGLEDAEVSPLSQLFDYPELVPCVLEELSKPAHLAAAAAVCRQWNRIARRLLYADIWVRPWESAPKEKLVRLFSTLNANRDLCELVRSLDVRFFPLDLQGEAIIHLEDEVRASLSRMVNLERLVWTRDRSISSELFAVMTSLPRLSHLELSGHSTNQYDPSMLRNMTQLEDLRIMMPDATFRAALPTVIETLDARERGGLRGLSLVCKQQNLITDAMLRDLAPHLAGLTRLTLIGGTRITKTGVYALLESARGIEELVLDASPYSHLLDLSDAPECAALKTFSLSFPATKGSVELGVDDMPRLCLPDLRALELNLSTAGPGGQRQRIVTPNAFAFLLTQVNFANLRRLVLLNLVVDADVLESVIHAAPALRELYITVGDLGVLATCGTRGLFDRLPLRIFHANGPPNGPPVDRRLLAELAVEMPVLEQVGSMNRVYEVHRRYDSGGTLVVELGRWSKVTTPGYFQVWRP